MSLFLENGNQDVLYVGFNQDQGCFACGMDNGFRIYNCEPFKETFRRADFKGGIGIVEMLFRCNLLALVGGGRNPKFPPNIVKIWDDHQNRAIGELMFRSEVKAVKLRRDRVVVVLLHKIYVYRFSDLKLLDQISTLENPRGLIALCPDSSSVVLACPGVTKGNVRVELYDLRKSQLIPAHESELAAIALNQQGTRLATASDKGTLIRVFDTHTGELLKELRRGMERAFINCIIFNKTCDVLACSSDKGTCHIFSLLSKKANDNTPQEKPPPVVEDENSSKNATSNFSLLRRIIPGVPKYVDSEWSFAQVRGLEPQTICAFGQDPGTLIVVGADGSYLLTNFAQGGECEKVTFSRFVRASTDTGSSVDQEGSTPSSQSTSN
jgi:WD40 repeat protein